jgi:branched-chain amino acid transport system permease protein
VLNELIVPGVVQGALFTLIAVGINILFPVTGIVNFAYGDFIAWAPLAVLIGEDKLHVGLAVAIIGSAVFLAVLALVEERICIRPFLHATSALPWILSTLAASLVLEQLANIPYSGNPQLFPFNVGLGPLHIGPIDTTPVGVLIVGVAAVAYLGMLGLWRYTRLGKKLEAISEDAMGAQTIGISMRRASQIACLLSAAVAFATGIVAAPLEQVYPGLGLNILFSGFIGVAIGGFGSLSGSVVGGMFVGFASQAVAVYLGPTWVNTMLFTGLLLVFLVRPQGFFGRAQVRVV